MEDEYSTDVNMFFKNPNQENPQQLPSSSACVGGNNFPQGMDPNMFAMPQNINPNFMRPTNEHNAYTVGGSLPFVPQIESFNAKESIQSVVVIVVLFMILASGTFKNLISPIGFFRVENGNYTFLTLLIVGLLFAVLYTILKLFLF